VNNNVTQVNLETMQVFITGFGNYVPYKSTFYL